MSEDSKWIGVDLDGTLAKYDGWKGPDNIGAPVQAMVDKVIRAIGRGKNIKIFTARVAGDNTGIARRAIRTWCRQHLGLELPVTCIKDQHCEEIWDDRAKKVYRNKGTFQKGACGDMIDYFNKNPKKYEEWKERQRKRQKTAALFLLAKEARLKIKGTPVQPQSKEQAEAGNYPKAHTRMQGMDITIENLKGQYRRGVSADGKEWKTLMRHHYGYIKRTKSGADGDHVDVFIGPDINSEVVFVVNQVDPKTGKFDEHKCMLGFTNSEDAKKGYLANYEKGWKGFSSMAPLTMAQFKQWTASGDTSKPLAGKVQKIATELNTCSVLRGDMSRFGFVDGYQRKTAAASRDLGSSVATFLENNPNPSDDRFHQFADRIGANTHEAEAAAYRLATLAAKLQAGGRAKEKGVTPDDVSKKELAKGSKVETEHTADKPTASRIALDHLAELPDYYTRLDKMESQKSAQEMENVKTLDRLSARELSRAIRDALIAEEGAVKQYETISDSTENRRAAQVLQDIADEEKVHIGELQKLLDELDPEDSDFLEEGEQEVDDAPPPGEEKEASLSTRLLKRLGRV